MRLQIKVSPDGKEVAGLYSDNFPWKNLGKLEIKRASNVYFCHRDQEWKVHILTEGGKLDLALPCGFKKRKDAIAYEIYYLQTPNAAMRREWIEKNCP